jgi:hypothetical protein
MSQGISPLAAFPSFGAVSSKSQQFMLSDVSGGVIMFCRTGFAGRHAKVKGSRTYDDTLCGNDCCGSLRE